MGRKSRLDSDDPVMDEIAGMKPRELLNRARQLRQYIGDDYEAAFLAYVTVAVRTGKRLTDNQSRFLQEIVVKAESCREWMEQSNDAA